MSFINNVLKSRFAKKYAGVIGLCTIILFVINPELLSFVLLMNVIGADIFILLVGIQLRQNWTAINVFLISPIHFWFKRVFMTKQASPALISHGKSPKLQESVFPQSATFSPTEASEK